MEQTVDYEALFGMLTGIIISLAFFAAIFFSFFYAIKARNKERMALIEHGVDVSTIYRKRENKNGFFKFGFILIGVALGLIFGAIFSASGIMEEPVSYFAMILLFGGGGVLLANHLITKKETK